MKQNLRPTGGKFAKSTGVGLGELDGAVEALRTGVADFFLFEVEQTSLAATRHMDHRFDRRHATAYGVGRPKIASAI